MFWLFFSSTSLLCFCYFLVLLLCCVRGELDCEDPWLELPRHVASGRNRTYSAESVQSLTVLQSHRVSKRPFSLPWKSLKINKNWIQYLEVLENDCCALIYCITSCDICFLWIQLYNQDKLYRTCVPVIWERKRFHWWSPVLTFML